MAGGCGGRGPGSRRWRRGGRGPGSARGQAGVGLPARVVEALRPRRLRAVGAPSPRRARGPRPPRPTVPVVPPPSAALRGARPPKGAASAQAPRPPPPPGRGGGARRRGAALGRACPRASRGRRVRSKTRRLARFRDSRYLSRFAASFILAGAETSAVGGSRLGSSVGPGGRAGRKAPSAIARGPRREGRGPSLGGPRRPWWGAARGPGVGSGVLHRALQPSAARRDGPVARGRAGAPLRVPARVGLER